MSIEDLTGHGDPVSMPAEDREIAAYGLMRQTLDDGDVLEEAVKDVFALYGVDADGWQGSEPRAA
jgi:hypothetical protein